MVAPSYGSATYRIGIIGGGGWLGHHVANAIVAAEIVRPEELCLSGRSMSTRQGLADGAAWTTSNDELVQAVEIVLISVRPEQFGSIRLRSEGKLVVSLMAGIGAAAIAEATGSNQIVRAMPNAAAEIRRSFTPWYALPEVSEENRSVARRICAAFGEEAQVREERHIDYFTAATGSGAAFPALLCKALADHAIAQGIDPDLADRAAKGVVAGASQLLDRTADPDAIVRRMIDYDGVVSTALREMVGHGFLRAVEAGVAAGAERARRMGSADENSL